MLPLGSGVFKDIVLIKPATTGGWYLIGHTILFHVFQYITRYM